MATPVVPTPCPLGPSRAQGATSDSAGPRRSRINCHRYTVSGGNRCERRRIQLGIVAVNGREKQGTEVPSDLKPAEANEHTQ